jgi:hypothetical protein
MDDRLDTQGGPAENRDEMAVGESDFGQNAGEQADARGDHAREVPLPVLHTAARLRPPGVLPGQPQLQQPFAGDGGGQRHESGRERGGARMDH